MGEKKYPGMVSKAARLKSQEVTDAEIEKINQYSLSPLSADEVFTFKAVLCDNAVDRQNEHFNLTTLNQLKELFLGKTVIKDHEWSSDNQVARIYDTELVEVSKADDDSEPYTQLVAHCYMVKTSGNADLIAEIKGGIKKEGSVGFAIGSFICDICGCDNRESYCKHFPGVEYDGTVCTFTLDNAIDAYEFSLVAVPAQKAAGACKSYNGETVYPVAEKASEPNAELDSAKKLSIRARKLALASKLSTYDEN